MIYNRLIMADVVIEQKTEVEEKPETTYYSGILFHGAKKQFSFRSDYFDIDLAERLKDDAPDGSFTLGEGLYLADNKDDAQNYSRVRQSQTDSDDFDPFIYSSYAPDCKFLDFRGEFHNVPVPNEAIKKWIRFYKDQIEQRYGHIPEDAPEYTVVDEGMVRRRKPIPGVRKRNWATQYTNFLEEVQNSKDLDLREMLGTSPARKNQSGFDGNYPSPDWTTNFRNFVVGELGYDGIIYSEGGEGEKARDHDSFVVYNLDKIHFSEKTL